MMWPWECVTNTTVTFGHLFLPTLGISNLLDVNLYITATTLVLTCRITISQFTHGSVLKVWCKTTTLDSTANNIRCQLDCLSCGALSVWFSLRILWWWDGNNCSTTNLAPKFTYAGRRYKFSRWLHIFNLPFPKFGFWWLFPLLYFLHMMQSLSTSL